ncbi:cytochrome c oxidase assembly protein [Actinomycetospora lemnae]|uniref:Cytochrome c oxidase assembly protein n=1 Tax=Actinomycetospora lemnae TaxID=3019891 RepID=A0ABT5SU45_9PSEU|nr:cytochrome c oxidase assembly protein [Actinomycetospora sp. DW7H6]MDD7965268.1 cytochrome c oxidase assembly protein [Actinomycetospora sp. DW7H6]
MSTGWWPALPLLAVAGAYLAAGLRLHRRGDCWPLRRWAAAAAGVATLGIALLPPLATHAHHLFVVHVVAHLLLAMVAPLLLALGAPVTLALRALPTPGRRHLLAVLHSAPACVVTWPPAVLVLELGGMAAFYLTDLFALAHAHPALMALVDLHMVLAGFLLATLLVGPDPLPRRPGTVGALLTLLVAAAGHDVLAKLMYARLLPAEAGSAADIRLGAQVMYYGGSAVEVALAVALMAAWYARGGRELRRERRRTVSAPAPARAPVSGGHPAPG